MKPTSPAVPAVPKRLLLVLAALAVALAAAAPAHACTCAPPGPPAAELAAADAVFSGRVISVEATRQEDRFPRLTVRFALAEVWKGLPEGEVATVTTAGDSAACGYHFEPGEEYLVYAQEGDPGSLSTGLCTRTSPLDDADEDLAALGEPERRVAEESTKP